MSYCKYVDIKNRYKLSYDLRWLEPYITSVQLEWHYEYHLMGYYNKLEKLIMNECKFKDYANVVEIMNISYGKPEYISIYNNAAQIVNHILFFESMKRNKDKAIDENSKNMVMQMYTKVFGSGWIWGVRDTNGDIKIFDTPNAFNPIVYGFVQDILFCIDMWEHAYYIQYRHNKDDYIENILKLISYI